MILPDGAKHSPPGDSGVPDWSEGFPPVCGPGDPFGAKHSPPAGHLRQPDCENHEKLMIVKSIQEHSGDV